jgi:hypothetical protein
MSGASSVAQSTSLSAAVAPSPVTSTRRMPRTRSVIPPQYHLAAAGAAMVGVVHGLQTDLAPVALVPLVMLPALGRELDAPGQGLVGSSHATSQRFPDRASGLPGRAQTRQLLGGTGHCRPGEGPRQMEGVFQRSRGFGAHGGTSSDLDEQQQQNHGEHASACGSGKVRVISRRPGHVCRRSVRGPILPHIDGPGKGEPEIGVEPRASQQQIGDPRHQGRGALARRSVWPPCRYCC